jgi:hypothetical protein
MASQSAFAICSYRGAAPSALRLIGLTIAAIVPILLLTEVAITEQVRSFKALGSARGSVAPGER